MPVVGRLHEELDPVASSDLPPEDRRMADTYLLPGHVCPNGIEHGHAPPVGIVYRIGIEPIPREREAAILGAVRDCYPGHIVYLSPLAPA
ncbi:MAG: hypothetical protein HYY37_04835 [Candidatus Aenigmarchaeota archaeon]|nr:hypothetical protein [Candidatus Aenigmarchaeota archaeon]